MDLGVGKKEGLFIAQKELNKSLIIKKGLFVFCNSLRVIRNSNLNSDERFDNTKKQSVKK